MDQLFAIKKKAVATRLNIDDFSTNPLYKIRWHLYLRALAKLQSAPPSDITGYYRLAGIKSLFSDFALATLLIVSSYSRLAACYVATGRGVPGEVTLLQAWNVSSITLAVSNIIY